jgi:uncharacterized protein (TIGR02001 family)
MKSAFKMKSLVLSMAIAGSSVAALAPATTQAGVTGNVGMVNQYIFRGIEQSSGATAQAGIDYEHESGFYVGLWGSEVGPKKGLEYDIYAGYATEISGLALGAGVTLYNYTKDVTKDSNAFDSSYQELNLSLGYGPISVGFDIGKHAKAQPTATVAAFAAGAKDEDYTVLTVTYEYESVYATYGSASGFALRANAGDKKIDHSWLELGYGTEISDGFELSTALMYISKEASGYTNNTTNKSEDNMKMVFGITKTFDIM